MEFIENPNTNIHIRSHLASLFSLSISCRKLNRLNLASKYNKKGVTISSQNEDIEMNNLFVQHEGIVLLMKNNLDSALDSLNKSTKYFESKNLKADLAISYYFLSQLYFKKKEDSLAVDYLKKVDTIFQLTNDIHPETEPTYKLLTNYYREKGDLNKELIYLNKLILVDSTLNSYKDYLDKGIKNKYDLPRLINQRDQLINLLKKEKYQLRYIIALILLILISVFLVLKYRHRKLNRRFELLLENLGKKGEKESKILNSVPSKLSSETKTEILEGLKRFEESQGYANRNLTLTDLAKSLNTNSSYLSKVINAEKKKNFSSYLNDLRLDLAVTKLIESPMFRSYKISAIAREVGFNNTETFSKLFRTKNGIYPSFFIKQLARQSSG